MLKTVHSLLLKAFTGPFMSVFFVMIFILLMNFVWKYIDELVGKGLGALVIGELLWYACLTFVAMALPLSILFSSLLTFGNLGESSELTAMKTSGMSLITISKPLFFLSVILAVITFYFANNVVPAAYYKQRTLRSNILQKKQEINIQTGLFNYDIPGYVLKAASKSKDGKILYDLIIYEHTDGQGTNRVMTAKEATIELTAGNKDMYINMRNGATYHEVKEQSTNFLTNPTLNTTTTSSKRELMREFFEEQRLNIDLSSLQFVRDDKDAAKTLPGMLNLVNLDKMIDTLKLDVDTYKLQAFKEDLPPYFSGKKPNSTPSIAASDTNKKATTITIDTIKPVLESFVEEEAGLVKNMATDMVRNRVDNAKFILEQSLQKEEELHKYEIEWHRKFTISYACMIFFVLGASLGSIVKKGGVGLPAIISVAFFVILYLWQMFGEKLSRENIIPVWVGMWLPYIIITLVSIYVSYKANKDTKLFENFGYKKIKYVPEK